MKIIVVTQARFSSTRLPGKVLKKLGNESVLGLHLDRIKKSKLISDIVVATTQEKEAEEIANIALAKGCRTYHGSLDDVLDRFYQAVKNDHPDYVIRLTSDCPLIDPEYLDDLVEKFLEAKVDYASNCLSPTLPDGMDAEIFSFSSLLDAWTNAQKKSEREHVTPYIRDCGKFTTLSVEYAPSLSDYRLTLDTEEDYILLAKLVSSCGEKASLKEYITHLQNNPEWLKINAKYERNEGYKKSINGDS